jgi:thiamine-phosphate pyrophosphorylase
LARPQVQSPQLHLVTEPHHGPAELMRRVALALEGGVDWVQLRDKSAPAATLFELGARLLRLSHERGARLAINDRLDVALALRADGIHLAGQSLPVAEAVRLADQRLRVGRSVHALAEAQQAAAAGAAYVTFGPVFPTRSHPGMPPRGLDELANIVRALDVPVLAIGGITAENLPDVLATGCAGVAVISAILSDPDPAAAAARLRRVLDRRATYPQTFQPIS